MKNNSTLSCVDPLGIIAEGKSYPGDIGIDVRSTSDPLIVGHQLQETDWKYIHYIEYDTGISLSLDERTSKDTGIFLFPRSSISNYWLSLSNSVGIIDHGYRDTIKVRFKYLPQPCDYIVFEQWLILRPSLDRIYKRGDKIAQLVFAKLTHPEAKMVNELPASGRGKGGFGSSGN